MTIEQGWHLTSLAPEMTLVWGKLKCQQDLQDTLGSVLASVPPASAWNRPLIFFWSIWLVFNSMNPLCFLTFRCQNIHLAIIYLPSKIIASALNRFPHPMIYADPLESWHHWLQLCFLYLLCTWTLWVLITLNLPIQQYPTQQMEPSRYPLLKNGYE